MGQGECFAIAMTKKLDDRIATLETTLQQLKVRQQRAEARARALFSRRQRAKETRRKILVGSILLATAEQGEFESRTLKRWLDKALTRKEDRKLFGM